MKRPVPELAWRLLPGSIAAIVLGGLLPAGWLNPLEHLVYNTLFQIRGQRAWSDKVVLIAIDDRSIQALGRYPWPRREFTQLMQRLNQAEPSVVAFDVLFSESSPDDPALARQFEQHGQVILAQAIDTQGLPLMPVNPLKTAAVDVGHIQKKIDQDGMTRAIQLQQQDSDSLSLQAVKAYGLSHPIPTGTAQRQGALWLNWVGPARSLPHYSLVDVLRDQVPPAALRDKIVLIGITATGFDTLATPFDQDPPATGVLSHATAIHNLLQNNSLRPIAPGWLPGWLVWMLPLLMPGLGLGLSYLRTVRQMLVSGGLVLGLLVVQIGLFSVNIWLPIVAPVILVVATATLVALTERLRMSYFLQSQVQYLWQTYPGIQADRAVLPSSSQFLAQPASIQTLTQLTELAQHLGRSQATQAAIASSLSIGILAADEAGKIWFANPSAQKWLEVESGQNLPNWLNQADQEVLKNDRWFWLKFESLELPDSQHLLLLVEDITSRKQLEENLTKQIAEIQWVAQLKDDFISTVSHEMRSPLTNMILSIELMRLVKAPQEQERYLNQLERECLRERDFVNDLLNLRVDRLPDQAMIQQPIALQTWLPELISPFQVRATTRQQTIRCDCPAMIPVIFTEVVSLERILKELMTNACKYTPPNGDILLHVKAVEPNMIAIVVQNFGVEIPAVELPLIFDKFYRIPQSDPWKQGGTGLGLAIVQRLTARIGGTIGVTSESGYTQFTVQLPISPS
jgi:CHASE2 domain-containing sensor protein/nitrogen-specific signal transduction histidine kinase